jgi:hypothetical protein
MTEVFVVGFLIGWTIGVLPRLLRHDDETDHGERPHGRSAKDVATGCHRREH